MNFDVLSLYGFRMHNSTFPTWIIAVERAERANSDIIRIKEEHNYYFVWGTNSQIHHLLLECISFNQRAVCIF